MNDDVAGVATNDTRHQRPPKIKLRLNIPARDDDDEKGRAGTTRKRTTTTTTTTTTTSRENSMSMSMGASMSLGEHGDEHGDEATQGMSFLSPPTGRQKRHTHSPATTPMSVGTSPRISSKRPRMSNDWIEDEVHPSMVMGTPGSGGTAAKRLTSEIMASNLSQLLSVSPMSTNNDGGTACAVDESWTSSSAPMSFGETVKSSTSLLKRTLSGTYGDTTGMLMLTAPQLAKSPTESMMVSHHGGGGLPPSSPSDPSPIHDLRKAALMRSRLLNVSSALPPRATPSSTRGNHLQRGFVHERPPIHSLGVGTVDVGDETESGERNVAK